MACKCAKRQGMFGRYGCDVTGDECVFLIPNAHSCATVYGEGPESEGLKYFMFNFYTFDGVRHSAGVHGKNERDARIRLREMYGKICKIEVIK